MTKTVFDNVSIASGATETGTHTIPFADPERDYIAAYYINGDSNTTDIDIEWRVQPREGTTFYHLNGGSVTSTDASSNKAYELNLAVADAVECAVTNNNNVSATLSMEADISFLG